jgi:hypothetical protein
MRRRFRPRHAGCPRCRTATCTQETPIVIDDSSGNDIRALFDWRQEPRDAAPSPVANDDLALALRLLSCNPLDREQFARARPATDAAT